VAVTANVNTTKVDQPIINVTAPEAIESMPIGQLAEPAAMVTITVSEKTHRIPTRAVGLTISDQALESSTLDLVGLAMTGQARGERIRRAEADLKNMIDGDTDTGNGTGVTAVASTVYDSALAAGDLSQKAWIKWLRANYRQMTPDWLICGVDEALVIENRTNKPTNFTDDPNSTRMDALFTVENLGIRAPRVLLVDTSGANPVIGANDIIGLDSSQAIRRVVNVSASYEAVESYVMRRATSFRVDYGSMMHRLFESAWQRMTF
ncbi:MAG: hypothetical protein KAJ03_06805, partial [Gammaproteobacteria bacterium]|nr:hypothetical protein [Gammaproteobacteria bacterium]